MPAKSGFALSLVSGVIRQLETPDALRGRMTGINMVFFMGGPQLGELKAGLVATAAIAVATPARWKYRR